MQLPDTESEICLQVPCLTYGMRGMIAASVEVKGPARDLHSGNDGGPPKSFTLCSVPCACKCNDLSPPIKQCSCQAGVRSRDMLINAMSSKLASYLIEQVYAQINVFACRGFQ